MSEVHGLFPTPLFKTKLNRGFTEKEMNFILENENKVQINNYNTKVSANKNILNSEEFNDLKNEINNALNNYKNIVLNTDNQLELYITQSWISYMKDNYFHNQHNHLNSFVSGVLYIQAKDNIMFLTDKNNFFELKVKQFNDFNSQSFNMNVETGDLILFPSHLIHLVPHKINKNKRISLAFNTFIKGEIGRAEALTELNI